MFILDSISDYLLVPETMFILISKFSSGLPMNFLILSSFPLRFQFFQPFINIPLSHICIAILHWHFSV